jgi:hypothetical protein
MPSLLRQPLVWFLCISGALFIADARTSSQPEAIVVSPAVRQRIALLWETQMGTSPTANELESLVAGWIEEEALYREAMQTRTRSRRLDYTTALVQKLNFIAESDPVAEPEEATLEAFYASNIGDYTLPERLTFSSLLSERKPRH